MKFLLNMNVPREVGRRLLDEGHQCSHVGDIGMAQASDKDIVEEARRNEQVIITHDLDYGDLLAFSGESTPSVIIFRLRDTYPENLFALILSAWSDIERALLEGAIVLIEDTTLRIRKLPIV